MKSSMYFLILVVGLTVLLGIFGGLHAAHILELPLRFFYLLIGFVPFLFLLGAAIAVPGFKKAPENFVARFMILTTFQMLAVLSVIAAVWYTQKGQLKAFGFQLLALFVAGLILQSVLLVLANRNR